MQSKVLKTAAKVILSLVLLYFVFSKIDTGQTLALITRADPGYVLLAIALFTLSKFLSALRLNQYFDAIGAPLRESDNLRLYLLGMFYNLFLPGGIGGDAYKGYLIRKQFGVPVKRVVSALLTDRLSGLLLLFIFACLIAFLLPDGLILGYLWVFALAALVAPLVFWYLQKKFSPTLLPVYWKAFLYSALVQGSQLLAVLCIMQALGVQAAIWTYLFIFLLSSIVAVLPLTIGGIGSRELVFYYGALWLGLTEKISVSISLMFFLVTALVSLTGIYFHFRKPELRMGRSGKV